MLLEQDFDTIKNISESKLLKDYTKSKIIENCSTNYYSNMIYKLYKLHILYPLLWTNIYYGRTDYIESVEYRELRRQKKQYYDLIHSHYNKISNII